MKQLLASAKPDEKHNVLFDEYCCVICLLFVIDLVLCLECGVTICKKCNDQNKR